MLTRLSCESDMMPMSMAFLPNGCCGTGTVRGTLPAGRRLAPPAL
jgi:hypothetical protein